MSTALMQQYAELKEKSAGALLFFRLGDFYELFAQDAILVSRLLGITLTQRNGTPMCGVPHHASENYLAKLVALGYKVAIAEQMSKPEKGIALRRIVEVITPGTAVARGSSMLTQDSNYILSFYKIKDKLNLALLDVSRGDFLFHPILNCSNVEETLIEHLYKYPITELVASKNQWDSLPMVKRYVDDNTIVYNLLDDWHFTNKNANEILCKQFNTKNLNGFALDLYHDDLGVATTLLNYVKEQLQQELPHIKSLRLILAQEYLWVDDSSFRNLEILYNTQDGGEAYSLFYVINQTVSTLGRRKLREILIKPSACVEIIQARLDQVEKFYKEPQLVVTLQQILKDVYDMERLTTRVMLGKAHAKDLVAIAKSLKVLESMQKLSRAEVFFSENLVEQASALANKIMMTLADEPSVDLLSGNMIRVGFNSTLDELRDLSQNSYEKLEAYAERERLSSGLPLRLKENRVIGWFFEINKSHADKLDQHFIHRQSMAGGERYITEELKKLEEAIARASEEILLIEKELFLELRTNVARYFLLLKEVASEIADLDLYVSLAKVAQTQRYVRPHFGDGELLVRAGRHPVVEYYSEKSFVANDVRMKDPMKLLLITGPNMAGKSTYLRMSALITYLAHIGSFVPADHAEIPLCDRIFCRVGASDNLSRGASTFLVEMSETARILHYATAQSLVIVDEVGRGTGSDDGLAIARSIMEYLALKVRAFTLFATHYHELTSLDCGNYQNYSLKVLEDGESIFFTNEVVVGPASGSYGIHVAQMAGLPQPVVDDAQHYLKELLMHAPSSKINHTVTKRDLGQEELFSDEELLKSQVLQFDVNQSTPIEALNFLVKLQKEVLK